MNAAEIQAILNRITCDDWQLTVIDDPFHGPRFRAVKTNIPDNYGDGTIDKGLGPILFRLPPDATEQDVIWWVYKRLEEDVIHEHREKFRVDGNTVFNPHAEELTHGAQEDEPGRQ